MRYLGIDLGSKTVGLAISDTTLTIASSLKTIFFKDEDYLSTIDEIKNIIKEYDIQKIILGLPKNMNNTLGERAEITTKYKRILEENTNIPVIIQTIIPNKERKILIESINFSRCFFFCKYSSTSFNSFNANSFLSFALIFLFINIGTITFS